MIRAELSHNPYLLQTVVKFNGRDPRINCQIEKYEKLPLSDWIHQIPDIFYNEMNGYDFELLFIGTVSDFEEVKTAFREAGVSDKEVSFLHKNVLEDVETKNKEIDALVRWLRNTPNRKFDYNAFWEENGELFESAYVYHIIGGTAPEQENSHNIEVDHVASSNELSSILLTNTPVLFYICNENVLRFRENLVCLLSRKDIKQNQLFFMFHPNVNRQQLTRTIQDLGVAEPQIVSFCFDEPIEKYIRDYPKTEYIRKAIKVFEEIIATIGAVLEEENNASIIINAEICAQISVLETAIGRLKEQDMCFVQRDNYDRPRELTEIYDDFLGEIDQWKNRKRKLNGDYNQIELAADEYDTYLCRKYQNAANAVAKSYDACGKIIAYRFEDTYKKAGMDIEYVPDTVQLAAISNASYLLLKSTFSEMRTVTEEVRTDFFGLVKKDTEGNPETIRILTCDLDEWRLYARTVLAPQLERYIEEATEQLTQYYDALAEKYHEHLEELLKEKMAEKEQIASALSEGEQKLQQDNDWLEKLKDQLTQIERG